MGEKASKGSQIAINSLAGINLRAGRNQLKSGECDRIFGLYPSQTGLLSKMPGKTTWRVFEDTDLNPLPVYNVCQAFGIGIIVQAGDTVGIYTLDELRNRVSGYDITPIPVPGENDNTAILGHTTVAVDGGPLSTTGGSGYMTRTVNTMLTDSGNVVSSFAGNSFVLPLGTYRINARVTFAASVLLNTGSRAGLWSVTSGAFKTFPDTGLEILSTSGRYIGTTGTVGHSNRTIHIMGRFSVGSDSEVFQIRQAGVQSVGTWSSATNALGEESVELAGQDQVYAIVKIDRET